MKRPFRFAVGSSEASERTAVAERARRLEGLGYSAYLVADHILAGTFAPMPALVAAAQATDMLRVGTYVINNEFRHPALLAQEAVSVDLLSGGRLELGIGAGWNTPEFDAIGMTYEPIGARVSRLGESLQILGGLLTGERFSFQGRHYRINDLQLPAPAQRPRPPLMVGGGGRRVLGLGARYADIICFAPRLNGPVPDLRSLTLEALVEKVGWVREAAGERFDALELNTYDVLVPPTLTDQAGPAGRQAYDAVRRQYPECDLTEAELLNSPHVFIGSVDQICEKLEMLRERFGISYVLVRQPSLEIFSPVVARLAGR